jgi:hypothetical protein
LESNLSANHQTGDGASSTLAFIDMKVHRVHEWHRLFSNCAHIWARAQMLIIPGNQYPPAV